MTKTENHTVKIINKKKKMKYRDLNQDFKNQTN